MFFFCRRVKNYSDYFIYFNASKRCFYMVVIGNRQEQLVFFFNCKIIWKCKPLQALLLLFQSMLVQVNKVRYFLWNQQLVSNVINAERSFYQVRREPYRSCKAKLAIKRHHHCVCTFHSIQSKPHNVSYCVLDGFVNGSWLT